MEPKPIELRVLATGAGREPFSEWLDGLDRPERARVRARLNRLRLGNFGDCRSLGAGLFELRLAFGPGYRVYFSKEGDESLLLLGGGSKRTQRRDIAKARHSISELGGSRRG